MPRAHRLRYALTVLCLLVVTVELTGCSTISKHMLDQEYYLVEPSIASIQPSKDNPCASGPVDIKNVTDANVITYTDCIKKMLRRRMNLARIARLTSSSFAVLTAAAAAALGATAAAPLTAITALAATSAVIPEFSRIFGADERARGYQEGVALIEEAEGRYLVARAEAKAMPPTPSLTVEAAKLYVETVAAIKIVEHLLAAKLPTVDDILRAQGKGGQLGDIQVQPTDVTLVKDGDAAEILVLAGVVTHAISSAPTIADLDNKDDIKKGTRLIRVKRIAKGADVTVTVATDGGRTAKITIKAP